MNGERYTILYAGNLEPGQTARHRMEAMRALDHEVATFNTALAAGGAFARAVRSFRRRVRRSGRRRRLSEGLIRAAEECGTVDLLWLDKGDWVDPAVLRKLKSRHATLVVGYLPDDFRNPANWSRELGQTIPLYDCIFTNRTFQLEELRELGCANPRFINKSFNPSFHRPIELSAEERQKLGGAVGFVGMYEDARARSMAALATAGLHVKVWGNGWKVPCRRLNLAWAGPAQFGQTYPKLLNAFDINLAFLRKANRDQHTSRSLEIPACRRMLLTERTPDHLSMFTEGVEAEYFETDDELIEKVRYYLAEPAQRQAIAEAGYERCYKSGYSTVDTVSRMLNTVFVPDEKLCGSTPAGQRR